LGVRIVAAAVLIPLVLALVWLGGWWFAGLLVLVGGLMAREWCAIVHGGSTVQLGLHLLAVLAATLVSGLYGSAAALACIALIWLAASVHARWPGTGTASGCLPGCPTWRCRWWR
jgi:phosphatidate cytidylyltransferase